MNNIEAEFVEYSSYLKILEWIGVGFLVLIVIEHIWDYLSKTRINIAESMANYAIETGNFLLEKTVFGLVFVLALFESESFSIGQFGNNWWTWVLAIFVADFIYYWMHRWEHEIRILWSYHSVHHSSPEFNLGTSLRLAWVEGMVEWIFFVPMVLIGFSPMQTLIGVYIVVIYQTWLHTQKIAKLGWLDKIFNTPSVHRVHHGSNKQYHDRNYGGILIIWDRLFSTYQEETEKVVYGVTKPVGSANPLTINFKELILVVQDVISARNMWERLKYVFGRPGWSPNQL